MLRWLYRLATVAGCALLGLNIYGQTRTLRHPELFREQRLRFRGDISLTYEQVLEQLRRQTEESPHEFALRINKVVQQGLAHVDWESPEMEMYLLVPPEENYLLYLMRFVRPADYRKYHFSNPDLIVERGCGICGDAACVMSSLLEREGIETQIAAFPGHVVVLAKLGDKQDKDWMLDPDFGVAIPLSVEQLQSPERPFEPYYAAEDYSPAEVAALAGIYQQTPKLFDSAFAFSPKHAMFESASYVLIWVLPATLVLIGTLGLRRRANQVPAIAPNETGPTLQPAMSGR